jgi:hypothetical protein
MNVNSFKGRLGGPNCQWARPRDLHTLKQPLVTSFKRNLIELRSRETGVWAILLRTEDRLKLELPRVLSDHAGARPHRGPVPRMRSEQSRNRSRLPATQLVFVIRRCALYNLIQRGSL